MQLLVTGYWLLVTGCWLPANGFYQQPATSNQQPHLRVHWQCRMGEEDAVYGRIGAAADTTDAARRSGRPREARGRNAVRTRGGSPCGRRREPVAGRADLKDSEHREIAHRAGERRIVPRQGIAN